MLGGNNSNVFVCRVSFVFFLAIIQNQVVMSVDNVAVMTVIL